jgi:hypothetical protein
MLQLIRRLASGDSTPVDPVGGGPSTNDHPLSTDPETVLKYALEGFDWTGTPVQVPPSWEEKAALLRDLRSNPAYAGIDVNVLIVLVYTVRLKASYAFGENVPNPADFAGISFVDWCKTLQKGAPSL